MTVQPDDAALTRSLRSLEVNSNYLIRLIREEGHSLRVRRPGDSYSIELRESEDGAAYFLRQQPQSVALAILLAYAHGDDIIEDYAWQSSDDRHSGNPPSPHAVPGSVPREPLDETAVDAGSKIEPDHVSDSNDTRHYRRTEIDNLIATVRWFYSEFSPAEREVISDAFQADGLERSQSKEESVDDEFQGMYVFLANPIKELDPAPSALKTAGEYVSQWASSLRGPETRSIALRLAAKSKSLLDEFFPEIREPRKAQGVHTAYRELMSVYYDSREEVPGALEEAIACANSMIRLAPFVATSPDVQLADGKLPTHKGYNQLITIREEQGDIVEALRLAREAHAAGWEGNWNE